MSSEEKEMLREALGAGEEISESLIERVGNLFTNLLPERKPLSGLAPIEKGQEILQERLFQERDKTASLQDEMARMRTTELTSPEQTNVVDRDEFNTTPIGTRLRLLAEENLRRNQEAKEAIVSKEESREERQRRIEEDIAAGRSSPIVRLSGKKEQEGTSSNR